MALSLGGEPLPLFVKLNEHKDFICTLASQDADWPDGAVIALEFGDDDATTWAAEIDGPDASWNVDKAVVDALIGRLDSSAKRRARLSYTEGSTDLPWAQGSVQIIRWGS